MAMEPLDRTNTLLASHMQCQSSCHCMLPCVLPPSDCSSSAVCWLIWHHLLLKLDVPPAVFVAAAGVFLGALRLVPSCLRERCSTRTQQETL